MGRLVSRPIHVVNTIIITYDIFAWFIQNKIRIGIVFSNVDNLNDL